MEYIIQGIKINKLDEKLKQDIDYQISLQGLNGQKININDNELQEFMKTIQENKNDELKITIYALDDSTKAVGNVSYLLINNPLKLQKIQEPILATPPSSGGGTQEKTIQQTPQQSTPPTLKHPNNQQANPNNLIAENAPEKPKSITATKS